MAKRLFAATLGALLVFACLTGCSGKTTDVDTPAPPEPQAAVEWLTTTDFKSGIELSLPKETTVVDNRDTGGSLVFVANDKAWTLSIMTISVSSEIADTLLTDPTLAASLKTGWENSVGVAEYLIDEVSTLNEVDVLHITYQYDKDGAAVIDEHIVFAKDKKIYDIMLSYAESSDITEQIIAALVLA